MQFAISRWSNTIELFPPQQALCHTRWELHLHYAIVTCPLQHLTPLCSVLRALREELSLQRARNHFKLTSSHELLKFSLTDGTVEGNGLHCNSIIGCQCEMLRLYQTLVNGQQCPVSLTDREKGGFKVSFQRLRLSCRCSG